MMQKAPNHPRPTLLSSPTIHMVSVSRGNSVRAFKGSIVTDQHKPESRKVWSAPVLHRLTIDLTAIRQKRKGNTDAKGNGAVS